MCEIEDRHRLILIWQANLQFHELRLIIKNMGDKAYHMNSKILFLFLSVLFSCTHEKNAISPLLNYIPKNASVIIRINDDSSFKSELKNNDFIHQISKSGVYRDIFEKTKSLEHLQPKSESILAFLELGKESFELFYATSYNPDLFQLEGVQEKSVETLGYESGSIDKYIIDGLQFFSIQMDDKIIICTSQIPLENLIRNRGGSQPDPKLEKLLKAANRGKSANIIIHNKNSNPLLGSLLKTGRKMEVSGLTDFIGLDLDAGQSHLKLSGATMANDSIKNFVSLFRDTDPLNNRTALIAPINADAVLSYTFKEYGIFAKNQQRYLDRSIIMDTLFNSVEEIGHIYMNNSKAIVLNTYSSQHLLGFLNGLAKNSIDYQGNEIIELSELLFLDNYFNPLIKNFESKYYTILENAFVFSNDTETLQTIITNFKNGATFDKTTVFKTAMELLADESNALFISNADGIGHILNDDFSDSVMGDFKNSDLSKYAFAFQIVSDAGFYHMNLVIQKFEKEIKSNTTSPLFSVQLDAEIATDPQFVTNHRTGKKEIVVQDRENNLYLISTEGKVLWKKPLNGRIQGRIQQVDIFKNGRLQMAFTTDHQFLIVDRNGEEVKPFNKTFEGADLNPLGVFDYDQKKEYRFVVVQGNKILMYDKKGEIVKGFTYTTSENPVIGTPKHFRNEKMDYLVLQEESGDLKILDRVGNTRIKVGEKIDFSENEVYFYNEKFTLTDAKGVLHQIDESGKITKTNLNLNKDHGIDATTKALVVMNGNILQIKDIKVDLDPGLYTKPKAFLLNNKIYVAVTDLQNQKIYLFDSNGAPIPNFPVFGNSIIDLDDMDNDGKLELVVKDMDNSLLVYTLY